MEKELYDWFRERGCAHTTDCRTLIFTVLYLIENGFPKKGSLYKLLAEQLHENYYTVSKRIDRGTKKVWERDEEIFRSKDDPRPAPMTILHELVYYFSGEKIL